MTRSYGLTDVGRCRQSNEDAFLEDGDLGVFAVADGMGGHAAGEVASRIAIESMTDSLRAALNGAAPSDGAASNALRKAVSLANREICESARTRQDWNQMGTTVVALVTAGRHAVVAHVGDSRAYRVRDGDLTLLTRDHSWVAEQVRMGLLTSADARRHPHRNIVTRALGNQPDVETEVTHDAMRPGDLYLLCSDGLNTMLQDDEILGVLETHRGDLRAACEALVDAANERGGEDNTTVVLVEIGDLGNVDVSGSDRGAAHDSGG